MVVRGEERLAGEPFGVTLYWTSCGDAALSASEPRALSPASEHRSYRLTPERNALANNIIEATECLKA